MTSLVTTPVLYSDLWQFLHAKKQANSQTTLLCYGIQTVTERPRVLGYNVLDSNYEYQRKLKIGKTILLSLFI